MHWCWAPAAKAGDAGDEEFRIGNAVLSRWPIAAHAEVSLPTDGLTGESRVAVHARINAPGGSLPFFTTHLTYGPGLSHVRTVQVRRLAEFVAEHAASCAYPPLVMGDLNAEPGSDELRRPGRRTGEGGRAFQVLGHPPWGVDGSSAHGPTFPGYR
jgi:endonuclease/exonuclease/phosphatase family metal-dependent hydrolase